MSEQRKTRSSVAAPERAEETGSASRRTPLPKTIVHQTRTGRKRVYFPVSACWSGTRAPPPGLGTDYSAFRTGCKKADPHRATEAYPDPQQQPGRILPPI